MSMTFGVDFTLFFLGGFCVQTTLPDTPTLWHLFSFYDLFVWVFFYRGGNGYHFQGSRGGNDTRLHCLGTVEYLGLFFIALLPSTFLIFYGLFLCTSNLGICEQRFLATGMWLVGSGSETMGWELFLFEIDILGGLSRCASLDHYALKMLSFLLSFHIFWLCISFIALWGDSRRVMTLYGVELH